MIQLPWVSRRAYDNLVASTERLEVRHAALLAGYTVLHDKLLATIVDFAKKPEPVKLPERTKDEVIEAIHARAGTNGQVRACLSSWAMQQRRNKVPDDQIITGILVWASDDDSQDGLL